VRLRVAPQTATAVIDSALARSRRIDYPAGVATNLRSKAISQIVAHRLDDASRVLLELVDELTYRGALRSDLRIVLDVTAIILQRLGRPAWADLAATARSLPVVSLVSSVAHDLFRLPEPSGGATLSSRAAIKLSRSELEVVLASNNPPPAESVTTDAEAVFARRGELWEIGFAGRIVHVKASKGLDDLARLLGQPDHEVHCFDLIRASVDEATTGELLDGTARRQYAERVRELQTDRRPGQRPGTRRAGTA
jgi:hypothetical protein